MTTPLLGCIADDFTGATDLANNLVRAGMRTVQVIGVPTSDERIEADAIVVALKSRTIPADEAVAQSLQALAWLQAQGVAQIYFKYCSTFDSTPQGNIGPVTEALLDALHGPGQGFTIVCPAFPENQRTVYKGHLFVGDVLLSDSGMRQHPLTPMTDANLVRVMQAQTRRRVGLVERATVAAGAQAIRAAFARLQAEGIGVAVVDAITNDDLMVMGQALAALRASPVGSQRQPAASATGLPGHRLGQLLAGHQCAGSPLATGGATGLGHRPAGHCRRGRPGAPGPGLGPASAGQRTGAGLRHRGITSRAGHPEPPGRATRGRPGGAHLVRDCQGSGTAGRAPADRGRRRDLRGGGAGPGRGPHGDWPADRPRCAVDQRATPAGRRPDRSHGLEIG